MLSAEKAAMHKPDMDRQRHRASRSAEQPDAARHVQLGAQVITSENAARGVSWQ